MFGDIAAVICFLIALLLLVRWAISGGVMKPPGHSAFTKELGEDLARRRCTLVEAQIPPKYETGPFPQPGIVGDRSGCLWLWARTRWQFRHVLFFDADGKTNQAWARLFLSGDGTQIDWKPAPTGSIEAEQDAEYDK